jgi:hypothetical protein
MSFDLAFRRHLVVTEPACPDYGPDRAHDSPMTGTANQPSPAPSGAAQTRGTRRPGTQAAQHDRQPTAHGTSPCSPSSERRRTLGKHAVRRSEPCTGPGSPTVRLRRRKRPHSRFPSARPTRTAFPAPTRSASRATVSSPRTDLPSRSSGYLARPTPPPGLTDRSPHHALRSTDTSDETTDRSVQILTAGQGRRPGSVGVAG